MVNSSTLVKAKLINKDNPGEDIKLMFNPTEISLTRTVNWQNEAGNKSQTLLPKTNFSGVEPYKLTLKQLLFDTYETNQSVVEKYINVIKKGVTSEAGEGKRPPVYIFSWGEEYFHCVINSLTYTLTMFRPDGTPVRAMVDITLQEVDEHNFSKDKAPAPTGQGRKQPLPGE
ncbi:MAG: hypothetical protein LH474_08885 [Chamaesiphon sp.]|nr:hypothetical protein [Chamaesiphon sp.]